MITQELVHRTHTSQFSLKHTSIWLEDIMHRERDDVLHERQHLRPEDEHPPSPFLEGALVFSAAATTYTTCAGETSTPWSGFVLDPHVAERLLDMLELDEEAEEDLIPHDRLPGDDERERELDAVVECQSVDRFI
jgi:hypothetical protein